MPESYQPGARQKKYGQNHQISENRYAWVQTELGKFLILVGEDEGHGSDVVLFHPRPGKITDVTIGLAQLTVPELDALEALFMDAFKWARPVVERRDKEAQDAWNNGDDSHTRNYRPLPTVVYRKRPGREHYEGVHERPAGVPEGGGRGGEDHAGGVRGAGDELAQPPTDAGQPEDDSSSAD